MDSMSQSSSLVDVVVKVSRRFSQPVHLIVVCTIALEGKEAAVHGGDGALTGSLSTCARQQQQACRSKAWTPMSLQNMLWRAHGCCRRHTDRAKSQQGRRRSGTGFSRCQPPWFPRCRRGLRWCLRQFLQCCLFLQCCPFQMRLQVRCACQVNVRGADSCWRALH